MDIKRREEESENQYIWRIGQAIDNGQIEGWKFIVDTLNKELRNDETEYRDESAYRKKYQYAKMFYDEIFSKYDEDDYMQELELKKRTIEKERQKLNATRNEYTRNIRQQSRFELFYEQVKNVIQELPTPELKEQLYSYNNDVDYLLTIADIHCGANFVSENNEYSLDICEERFQILLEKTIDFIKNRNVSHLNVLQLGDSIQGILRLNDLKINESSVVEATVFVSKLLANFLNQLSSYCEIDYYHCPTSNHSQIRVLNAKASELGTEDIEYIISNYIKDSLKSNDRINVHINPKKNYIDFNIHGFDIIAMHGHQIKNINSALQELSQLKRKFYDFVFLAHYHANVEKVVGENILCDTEVIVCPSFVGSDPYSDSLLKGSKASSKIYGISDEGHIETYKILLN